MMKKLFKKGPDDGGFTLVELLIVIALIGVLAAALVATLNPIEQINKARDARFKNDAAELLAALERYYATQLYYPWEDEVWGTSKGVEGTTLVGLTSLMPGAGVCYAAPNTADTYKTEVATSCITAGSLEGELIATDELKDSFANKEMFNSTTVTDVDKLYLFRGASSSGLYVCYTPKAESNRKVTSGLWEMGTPDDGAPTKMLDCTDATSTCNTQALITTNFDWTSASNSLFICVP
ncbi:MAG: type II secretion system protein [Patescibacteria group bacterium]